MGSVQRRIYPDAFKREAVERVGSSGLSVGKVAAELGIHVAILRRWVRQLSPAPAMAAGVQPWVHAMTASPADLVAENHRLRRENERLKMEREILKKTVTIFGTGAR
jgi:transposase